MSLQTYIWGRSRELCRHYFDEQSMAGSHTLVVSTNLPAASILFIHCEGNGFQSPHSQWLAKSTEIDIFNGPKHFAAQLSE